MLNIFFSSVHIFLCKPNSPLIYEPDCTSALCYSWVYFVIFLVDGHYSLLIIDDSCDKWRINKTCKSVYTFGCCLTKSYLGQLQLHFQGI